MNIQKELKNLYGTPPVAKDMIRILSRTSDCDEFGLRPAVGFLLLEEVRLAFQKRPHKDLTENIRTS